MTPRTRAGRASPDPTRDSRNGKVFVRLGGAKNRPGPYNGAEAIFGVRIDAVNRTIRDMRARIPR